VKIATSAGHAVLNDTQWFILATFKSDMLKNEVRELGDSLHSLSTYCRRYIRITSENTHVHLSKNDWSQLMDLASAYIDRKVLKFMRLQDKLVEWLDNCFESKSLCTPPNINSIDFKTLYDEVVYRTCLFNKSYPDSD
jgi:hypothetical protein